MADARAALKAGPTVVKMVAEMAVMSERQWDLWARMLAAQMVATLVALKGDSTVDLLAYIAAASLAVLSAAWKAVLLAVAMVDEMAALLVLMKAAVSVLSMAASKADLLARSLFGQIYRVG